MRPVMVTAGFVSVRDTVSAPAVPAPDWRDERDVVRAAGFGRIRTGGLLGDWGTMVGAADEAARRSITSDDVHDERPDQPTYRRLLDGWREVLQAEPVGQPPSAP